MANKFKEMKVCPLSTNDSLAFTLDAFTPDTSKRCVRHGIVYVQQECIHARSCNSLQEVYYSVCTHCKHYFIATPLKF